MSGGTSIDISQFRALASDVSISVLPSAYQEAALLFPSFCEVIDPNAASVPLYGDISTTLHFGTTPDETEDGQPFKRTTGGEGYRPQIKIRAFKKSIGIPRRMLDSVAGRANAEGIVATFVQQFASNAMVQKDQFVFGLLQNGGKTAGDRKFFDNSFVGRADANAGLIYDGVSFFNSAHPIKFGATTYDNADATALTGTNLDAAYTKAAYTNAVNESGVQIATPPDVLIVPTALRSTGQVLLGSDQAPGGANNDINTNRGLLKLVVSPYITTATAWAVLKSGTIRAFDSGAPMMTTWVDEDSDEFVVGLKYYFGAGVREWRGSVGNNFPTS